MSFLSQGTTTYPQVGNLAGAPAWNSVAVHYDNIRTFHTMSMIIRRFTPPKSSTCTTTRSPTLLARLRIRPQYQLGRHLRLNRLVPSHSP